MKCWHEIFAVLTKLSSQKMILSIRFEHLQFQFLAKEELMALSAAEIDKVGLPILRDWATVLTLPYLADSSIDSLRRLIRTALEPQMTPSIHLPSDLSTRWNWLP
jgi:hypothetical protein